MTTYHKADLQENPEKGSLFPYRRLKGGGNEGARIRSIRNRSGNGKSGSDDVRIASHGLLFLLEQEQLLTQGCGSRFRSLGSLDAFASLDDDFLQIRNLILGRGKGLGDTFSLDLGSLGLTLGPIHQRKVRVFDIGIRSRVLIGDLLLFALVGTSIKKLEEGRETYINEANQKTGLRRQ